MHMEGKGRRRLSLLERTAQALDLPADVVAGVPRLELVGDNQLRMENHRGILSYGTREIHVSGGVFCVRICGEELQLRTMNATGLLVTGHISTISLE